MLAEGLDAGRTELMLNLTRHDSTKVLTVLRVCPAATVDRIGIIRRQLQTTPGGPVPS